MTKTILTLQIEKVRDNFNKKVDKIQKNDEDFFKYLKWDKKTYIGTIAQQKTKYISLLTKHMNKEIKDLTEFYDSVMSASDFTGELVITIEWKKSQMWGMSPKASTNYGFEGSIISGCGYCKLSTATAGALNNDKRILKMLYAEVNLLYSLGLTQQEVKKKIGYGSGYGIAPSFEGGVGVSCHESILKVAGLKMYSVTSTENIDVYIIKRV